jgi:hypothetical protein
MGTIKARSGWAGNQKRKGCSACFASPAALHLKQ